MTKKKAVVFMEGNSKQSERFIHELNKLVSEANAQPELAASIQTEQVATDGMGEETSFTTGGDYGD